MKTLYRAIENIHRDGELVEKENEPISANYATKEELLNRMKERASYTVGIPFRVEEVYIIEEGDEKDLGGDK